MNSIRSDLALGIPKRLEHGNSLLIRGSTTYGREMLHEQMANPEDKEVRYSIV
jgi:hypothetical protein